MLRYPSTFNDDSSTAAPIGVADLLHQPVVNPRGEILGTVEDLMLDAQIGAVAYVVLRISGPVEHRKRFALPWHLLAVRSDGRGMVVDLSREALERSPGIEVQGDRDWLNDGSPDAAHKSDPGPATPDQGRARMLSDRFGGRQTW